MRFPQGYEWLGTVGQLPKMVTTAFELYGIHEAPGSVDNPTIMAWAKETGLDRQGYNHDSVPWCGLFMALVAKRSGYPVPVHPLWALNWASFGKKGLQPCLGDTLVFVRPSGGHVGLYIGEDREAYHVLGGNTSDQVKIARIEKERLRAVRSPIFKIGRPASSKPYMLSNLGKPISKNEA